MIHMKADKFTTESAPIRLQSRLQKLLQLVFVVSRKVVIQACSFTFFHWRCVPQQMELIAGKVKTWSKDAILITAISHWLQFLKLWRLWDCLCVKVIIIKQVLAACLESDMKLDPPVTQISLALCITLRRECLKTSSRSGHLAKSGPGWDSPGNKNSINTLNTVLRDPSFGFRASPATIFQRYRGRNPNVSTLRALEISSSPWTCLPRLVR